MHNDGWSQSVTWGCAGVQRGKAGDESVGWWKSWLIGWAVCGPFLSHGKMHLFNACMRACHDDDNLAHHIHSFVSTLKKRKQQQQQPKSIERPINMF